MLILIDADPIVYRAGFAAEKSSYNVYYYPPAAKRNDEPYIMRFEPSKGESAGNKMKKWLAKHPDAEIVDKERTTSPSSVNDCLNMVKTQLTSIIWDVEKKYNKTVEIIPVLSGPGNFREKIATIRPYKGNRDALHKPYHYQNIRNYLCNEYGSVVTAGNEADDWISIEARDMASEHSVVIATIDKDLDQIPGIHYNYAQRVHYKISEEEGIRFFYTQALSGDSTDGIPGCYKVGFSKAERFLKNHQTQEEMWDAIVAVYAASQSKPGCPYKELPAADVALETARLVKLQEYPYQLWNPPGVFDELIDY
jgi:hypothetical protein